MSLNVAIAGISEVVSKMIRLSAGLEDRTKLHEAMGITLRNATDERFKTGTAPDGSKWKQSLRAKLQGGQTLRDTGLLQSSITFFWDRNGLIFGSLNLGSNLKYARIHQYGGVIVPKKAGALRFALADGSFAVVKRVVMPARPYIGVSAEDEEDLVDTVLTYMKGLIK